MNVSLWLGLREFGRDFEFAAPPQDTTAHTLAPPPNESLMHSVWHQKNLYCTVSGTKWITNAQCLAPKESLLHSVWHQTNH